MTVLFFGGGVSCLCHPGLVAGLPCRARLDGSVCIPVEPGVTVRGRRGVERDAAKPRRRTALLVPPAGVRLILA